MTNQEMYRELENAVVEMDEDLVVELAEKGIAEGMDAFEMIDKGLTKGMDRAGQLFEEEEYFVPELLMCADSMNAGVDVLKPHIKSKGSGIKHKVLIGVVEGDTHDIGKNLVKLMLETAGFEVIDIGRDVPPQQFVDKAVETGAELIGISTLMTTTMEGMEEVIQILEREGLRDKIKIIVGGGPISSGFAKQIGADGYSANAASAVKLAQELLGE